MDFGISHLGFGLAWLGIICWLTLLLSADYENPWKHEKTVFFLGLGLVLVGIFFLFGGDTFSYLWKQTFPRFP